jgi:hypothetical protein
VPQASCAADLLEYQRFVTGGSIQASFAAFKTFGKVQVGGGTEQELEKLRPSTTEGELEITEGKRQVLYKETKGCLLQTPG